MTEHRVPLLGDSWRRIADPETSRNPQVRLVMAGLRQLATTAPAPSPGFRAELRAQLVAITPRIVAEGEPVAAPAPAAPAHRPMPFRAPIAVPGSGSGSGSGPTHAGGGTFALPIRRILAATTALAIAAVLLLCGAVYLSRDALPGDALYGVKLAAERVELATDSSSERPKDLLRFAGYRLDEARALAARAQASAAGTGAVAGTISPQTQSLIRGTLTSFDSDVRQASRLLGEQAVHATSAQPLHTLTSWAPAQNAKLRALSSSLQGTAVHSQVGRSMQLVTSATSRARALVATVDCKCLGSATDSLGPEPCSSTCSGTSHTSTPTSRSHPVGTRVTGRSTSGAATAPATTAPATGSTRTGAGAPSTTAPALPTPTLPIHLSLPTRSGSTKPPLVINSCGVQVNLGGLGINLGSCPSP